MAKSRCISRSYRKGGLSDAGEAERICCSEEVAFDMGFVSADQLLSLGQELKNSPYGIYLRAVASEQGSRL